MKTRARISRGKQVTRRRRGGSAEASKERALILISQERLSSAELAGRLGVSEITAKRIVGSLREAGHEIVSVRTSSGAYYETRDRRSWSEIEKDPLLATSIPARRARRSRGKIEDADYD